MFNPGCIDKREPTKNNVQKNQKNQKNQKKKKFQNPNDQLATFNTQLQDKFVIFIEVLFLRKLIGKQHLSQIFNS